VASSEGDAPPLRKKKQVPEHVKNILQRETLVEGDVLEHIPTASDFDVRERASPAQQPAQKKVIKTELYVRGIPWEMEPEDLKKLFAEYRPRNARVLKDKEGVRALGFGFVGFKDEAKAAKAMEGMQGKAVKNQKGRTTNLVISYATEKKKAGGVDLSSKAGRLAYNNRVAQRKKELEGRDMRKTVESIDDMPRRFKAIADRNPGLLETKELANMNNGRLDESDMTPEETEARAQRLVEMFADDGNKIEDVSYTQLAKEKAEEHDREVRKILWAADDDLDEDEDDEDDEGDEDWVFVPDGEDEGDEVYGELKDMDEETEEERRNWEEYKKKKNM